MIDKVISERIAFDTSLSSPPKQPGKPARPSCGRGTALSLSYDIARAHGGELNMETKEGEGSEFILKLPTT